MKLTNIFRRLVSHFFRSTSETTKEAKQQDQQQRPAQYSPSSTTAQSKTSATTSVTTTTMPGVTTATSSKYDQIPGPLGLASASLEGKVALVTGAGTYIFCYLDFSKLGLHPQFGGCIRRRGRDGSFTPTHVRPGTWHTTTARIPACLPLTTNRQGQHGV